MSFSYRVKRWWISHGMILLFVYADDEILRIREGRDRLFSSYSVFSLTMYYPFIYEIFRLFVREIISMSRIAWTVSQGRGSPFQGKINLAFLFRFYSTPTHVSFLMYISCLCIKSYPHPPPKKKKACISMFELNHFNFYF